MNALFAHEVVFWFELQEHHQSQFYDVAHDDVNQAMEHHWPCSDRAMFFPSIPVPNP